MVILHQNGTKLESNLSGTNHLINPVVNQKLSDQRNKTTDTSKSTQPFNPNITQSGEKRIRTLLACQECKKRKVKCNGTYPCDNCVRSKRPRVCLYSERPPKKKQKLDKSKKQSKKGKSENNEKDEKEKESVNKEEAQTIPHVDQAAPIESETTTHITPKKNEDSSEINVLDKRMQKLEKVMEKMTKTMELLASQANPSAELNSEKSSETNSEATEDSNLTSSVSSKLRPRRQNITNNTYSMNPVELKSGHQYTGSHSILIIFSKQSLDWMEQTLSEDGPEYIRPLRNLPIFLLSKMRHFMTKWVDPPLVDAHARKRLLESPFPRDSKLIFELVDIYFSELNTISILVDVAHIKSLFKSYYNKPSNLQKKKRFTLSELLIMTSVLLIGLTYKLDSGGTKEMKTKLSKLLDSLTNNAIYYYQRLCVVSEGIETVEAILLFIIYLEFSWITSHLNYIPISVAIRYAQELGLHRSDSFAHLNFKEQERRRRVWWFCYYFDTEICFRGGKPPTINTNDVTTNSDQDMLEFCLSTANAFSVVPSESDNPKRKLCLSAADEAILGDTTQPLRYRLLRNLKTMENEESLNVSYYHYFSLLLARIKSDSYHSLFEATAQAKDFEVLATTLESLNAEMLELARWSEEDERPRFYHDTNFKFACDEWSKGRKENVLALQLTYFSHLMIINRFPFILKTKSLEIDDRLLKFRNIALDSARTILVLIKQLNKSNTTVTFYNWLSYLPVSAFMILCGACLNHPSAPEVPSDIRLLIESSLGFFDIKGLSTEVNTIKAILGQGEEDISTQIFIKLMLRIVIKNYENSSRITDFSDDKALQDHLNSLQTKFPELFTKYDNFNEGIIGASLFDDSSYKPFGYDSTSGRSSSSNRVSPYVNSPRYNPSVSNIMHPDRNGQQQYSLNTSPSSDQSNQSMYQTLPPLQQQQYQPGQQKSPQMAHPSYNQFTPGQLGQDQLFFQPNGSNVRSNSNINNVNNTPNQNLNSDTNDNFNDTNRGTNLAPSPTQFFDNYDLLTQTYNDDGVSNIILNQMNSMPNFFFDNNLGI
ncbi:hypothetical protein KGF54_001022 [Candida jiufengensis]|uniref:uncharacterized protein n=1 Tax=Candida jiufengensis TaxID=497108 RepID=UPI0022248867|nr:uncharacterized protein KGF54_001022 [Candida jiufengensis]KAI5956547.1 hypothetical protein KGF54_001022 [Candida jiufengensis]